MTFVENWKVSEVEKALKDFYNKWDSRLFKQCVDNFRLPADKKVKELSRGMKMKLMLVNYLTFTVTLAASFLYFCLYVAILFPIYSKYAFSKVYIFANLPVYLIGIFGAYLIKKTDILSNLSEVIQYFTSHQNMIWAAGIGLGLVLLIISCPLSYMIYKGKEL